MANYAQLEDTSKGEAAYSLADDFDVLPSACEGIEFLDAFQCDSTGPKVASGNLGPKWDGRVFSERRRRSKASVTQLLDSENLEGKIAKRAGTRIHQETIAIGGCCLMIYGVDLAGARPTDVGAD